LIVIVFVTFAEFLLNCRRKQMFLNYTTLTSLHCLQQYVSLITTVLWWNMCFMEQLMTTFWATVYVVHYFLYKCVHF